MNLRIFSTPVGLLAIGILSACGGDGSSPSAAGSNAPDLHLVERGPMLITVRENGELKAANETRIRSEIESQTTLIFMEKEGQVVKKGQKLAELDVSDLREKRATQAIAVERNKASLEAARQNLGILDKELASAEAESKSKLEIAKIDVEKSIGRRRPEGGDVIEERITNEQLVERLRNAVREKPQYAELPMKVVALLAGEDGQSHLDHEMGEIGQQILEQVDQINIAQQRLALAKDTYDKSLSLAQDQYITQNELEGDKLDYQSQMSQVMIAWQKLDILVSYTLLKTKIDLSLKLANALLDVEKVMASNAAKRASQEADVISKEKEYELADERLKNYDQQIANAVILAPTDGLVVAAEVDDRSRDVVQEGATIRERQTLMILPDVTRMIAEVKVQESDIDKVRAGQLAVIQLEALPDQVFTGRVTRVSPVADSGSRWMSSTRKVYKTWVELDDRNLSGTLRPNMSASVEIRVGTVPDAIAVPVSAVRRVDKHRYVWLATKSGPKEQLVKIGRATTSEVEILEGLDAGQQIYLAPPIGVPEPSFPDAPVVADANSPPPPMPGELPLGTDPPATEGPPLTRETFQAAILAKHPELKAVFETEGFRAMRNADVRAAIEGDAELQAMSEQFMQQMMRARGQGGQGGFPGGGQGGPGGTRGQGGARRPRGESGGGSGNEGSGGERRTGGRDGE
jgi:RND family efflux transporter MFP subunit